MTDVKVQQKARLAGLTTKEAEESKRRYGSNEIAQIKRKSYVKRLIENFKDPIIKILIVALIINTALTFRNLNIGETAGIIIAIAIATVVSTTFEYGSERAFEKLQKEASEIKIRVMRDGELCEINAGEIVVYDVIHISAGDKIPADGIILDGVIKVDQSALNGESREVEKRPVHNAEFDLSNPGVVFRGSIVCKGSAIMQVRRVGSNTLYGNIANELQHETRVSPLKLRLEKLAKTISVIGYFAAALVSLTYLFNVFIVDSHFNLSIIASRLSNLRFLFGNLVKAFTIAITVVVVAVPEGLPMMITVVLSSNMKRMLSDNVLVRKLVGIETAGSLNILFCDKTGTITTGKLRVSSVITGDLEEVTNISSLKSKSIYKYFELCAIYNSEATFQGKRAIGGNATERAILEFLGSKNAVKSARVISRIPFDSKIKYSAVRLAGTRNITIIKGAPEKILDKCAYYINNEGREVQFETRNEIYMKMQKITQNMGRVLAIAITPKQVRDEHDFIDLTFIALVAIKDEIRKEVPGAVQELRKAGIQIVMITGDAKDTALAIAEECGITSRYKPCHVLTSDELARMSDETVKKILPKLCVVARALPSDKSRLVRLSQELDLVVGMTGDGINDAPALKRADVGFAMGDGTEIAKEASDIVILDNNIASIVKAVLYGRTIFKSIRKFIAFQLTMNLCAVGVSFFGQILGIDTPITVIQMLWVNIIMDTLGGLAFAGEAPLRSYMQEKPKRRDESILTPYMIIQVLVMGGFSVLLCSMFLSSEWIKQYFGFYSTPIYFMTAFFALFIFAGVANCFIARTERINILANLTKNKPFIFIMLAIIQIQIIMLYRGGETFRCAGLTLRELLLVVGMSLLVFPVDFVRKIISKVFIKEGRI